MSRLSTFALAATLAIGSFTTASDAFARGPGGHFSRGPVGTARTFSAAPRFAAPRAVSPRFAARPFVSPRFAARPYAYRGYPYRYAYRRAYPGIYPYYAYNSCYRWRTVWTAYGPQTVRVNVCGYPYAYRYSYPLYY